MMNKIFYYIQLAQSPWSFVSMFWSFNLFLSFVLFFKFLDKIFIFNFIVVAFISFCWWHDYSLEFNMFGLDFFNIEYIIKNGMILFILSEVMLFFSLFWSYFHFFLSPSMEIGSWPPHFTNMFEWLMMPMINTLVLLFSSITVTLSHYYLMKDSSVDSYSKMLSFTILLGLTFSFFQFLEYKNSFFNISDSSFGSIFFLLTGLHGMHVIVGSIFLSYVLIKGLKLNMSMSYIFSFELSTWYWHFVDLVWMFVYYFIYYLSN